MQTVDRKKPPFGLSGVEKFVPSAARGKRVWGFDRHGHSRARYKHLLTVSAIGWLISGFALCGTAQAQVVNGDFSAGATGWTSNAPPDSSLDYSGGQLTAISDDDGTGVDSRTYASQNLTAADNGFLSYELVDYTSTDYGPYDYPTVLIGGTFYWIRPNGQLTTSAAQGIDNDAAPTGSVTGYTNFSTGTQTIGFGVTSVDAVYDPGIAIWDNIEFQEVAQSPGAQTMDWNTTLTMSGANAPQVATNGPNSISVTLTVTNGILTLASTSGISITGGANGSATITFNGTPADVNNALDGLQYTPTPGYSGTDNLVFTASGGGQSDTDTIPITINRYDYTLTKTANPTSVTNAGEVINYTIVLTNTGAGDITGINASDTLMQGATPTNLALAGPTGDAGVIGTLDIGEVWTYTASHTVTQGQIDDGGNLVNTADVTSNEAANISANDTTTITSNPSISVIKTGILNDDDGIGGQSPGDTITWNIEVTNDGNVTLNAITVSDTLGTPTCQTSGNDTIATLTPGGAEPCTLSYTTTQADFDTDGGGDGDIDNSATADGTAAGGHGPVNDTGLNHVDINAVSSVEIVKTADDDTLRGAGDIITYSYVVTNTGNQTLTDVVVTDLLHNGTGTPKPAPDADTGAITNDVGAAGDSTNSTTGDSDWDALGPGDSLTVTATYTVTQTDVDTLQ